MKINKHHGSYNRSRRNTTIKYIVIHYTSTTASALNNCKYFAGGNRNASADYFVDDNGIWEYSDPSSGYYTWAVGDGHGKYGITNSNSINVEVVNAGGAFSSKEIAYLCELVPYLMKTFNVSADHVKRHYDASRKQCPKYYVDNERWDKLRKTITNSKASDGSSDVKTVQKWCNEKYGCSLSVDGDYGDKTKKGLVKALQSELNSQHNAGLKVDGKFGAKTKAACVSVKKGSKGNITKILQGVLICRGYDPNGFDGVFGSGTEKAVKAFQKAHDLSTDGVAGKKTFAALLG